MKHLIQAISIHQALMLGLLLAMPLNAQTTATDDFTNPTNWTVLRVSSAATTLAVSNGRMNYTTASSGVSGAVATWNGPKLPANQNWSLAADAHIDAFSMATLGQFVDVFLGVARTSDPLNTNVLLEFDRGYWGAGLGYDIGDSITVSGSDVTGILNEYNLISPDVSLRMDYDAAARTLTYYFDSNGAAGGYSWIAKGTLPLGPTFDSLGISPTETFTVMLVGSSELQTVASGTAYLSNLRATVGGTGGGTLTLAEAIDQPAQSITSSGNLPWTAQTTATHDGVDAARSGAVSHSQTSEMSTTVTGPGTLSFWWKVSSESDYDYLRFYIDGVEQSGKISGTVDWTQKFYGLTAGPHTLKWAYSKDGSESSGSDCGWVDQMYFIPGTPAPEIVIEQPDGTNLVDGIASVAFGSAGLGTTVVKTFTIRNLGALALTGLALSKDGTNASDFMLGSLGSTSLAAGASTTFTVTFAPGSEGAKSTTIHITSNDSDENPFDINLTGTAVPYIFTTSGGKITITAYTGPGGVVVIPSMIDELPVAIIGDSAFTYQSSLTSVTIPASVTSIGVGAFSNCRSLTSVTIPASVTSIGDSAFASCWSLMSVMITEGVTSIGANAFDFCHRLTDVAIPASVTSIGEEAFRACFRLRRITVDAANVNYSSLEGVLYNKDQTILLHCPEGKAGSVTIPNGVTNIGDYALRDCDRLTSITIPSSVTSIGQGAFNGCAGLAEVMLPNSVTSIGQYAFSSCISLTNVTISASGTSIGQYAFDYCYSLKSLIFLGDAPSLASKAFYGLNADIIVYFDPAKTGFTTPTWQGYAAVHLAATRKIAVEQPTGTNLVNGSASVDFDGVVIETTVVRTFTIRNLGTIDSLAGLALSKDGPNADDFTLGSLGATSLAPGASTSFTVTFAPGSEGTKSAIIHITSNDPNESPFNINVSGTGTPLPYQFTISAGKVTITGYSGLDGLVRIPSTINGLPVVAIGDYAFEDNQRVFNVIIPNGVTNIGEYAFISCGSLRSITIPNSVTSIGAFAFKFCGLEFVQIPSSVTSIGDYAFYYCVGLESVIFMGDAPLMGYRVFDHGISYENFGVGYYIGASGFTSPTWNGYPTVGRPAPRIELEQPSGVRLTDGGSSDFGSVAVGNSTSRVFNILNTGEGDLNILDISLEDNHSGDFSVSFPEVESLPPGTSTTFNVTFTPSTSAPRTTSIQITSDSLYNSLFDIVLIGGGPFAHTTNNGTITITGYTGLEEVVEIPATINGLPVTGIGPNVFQNNTLLTSIFLPASVTSIGNEAFSGCTNLGSLYFSGNAPSIGSSVFAGASQAVVYYLPGTTGWGSALGGLTVSRFPFTFTSYNGQITITSYTGPGGSVGIPSSIGGIPVTSVGDYAFSHCTGLTSVSIPFGITSIGNYAFAWCNNLLSVSIPASVTGILNEAFGRCAALTNIAVAAANPNYSSADGVLFNKALTELIQCPAGKVGTYLIPASVNSIKMYAFSNCSELTTVTIPASVTTIGDSAFYDCGITSVTIPASVNFITDRAFLMCSDLTTVNIPPSVSNIGVEAFSSCTSLTSVNIPPSVTSIGNSAFSNCTVLTEIAVDAANPNYSSMDGVLFDKALRELIQYPAGKSGAYTVPNGVTTIKSHSFEFCYDLTSVSIPGSVTSIDDYAFFVCRRLASALFTGNAPTMGISVFSYTSAGFKVYFLSGATGFSTPTWQGYPAELSGAGISITTHPASSTVTNGTAVTLTVVASGTGPFTYQWYEGYTGTTTTPVGTDSSSFTTPALNADTSYWVKVTNAIYPAGINSYTATVTIGQPVHEALDIPGAIFSMGGTAAWFGQSVTSNDGVDAARSGAVSHSQTSEMSTTVTGPGTLSFWWKVSSESDYDYLRFYIDGVEQSGKISGTVDWSQKSYELTAGPHTLKWAYSKDGSESFGSDCGWVDQVGLPVTIPSQETWRQTYFSTTANFGNAADSADPDKDGVMNLLEFAFGLHPLQNSSHLLPKWHVSGDNLSIAFNQPTDVSGIAYGAEWSPTMAAGTWLPLADTGTAPQHAFTLPMSGSQKFVRLKVMAP